MLDKKAKADQLGLSDCTCEEVCELLFLYITDELDEEEAKQVSAHLFTCKECRKSMSEMVKLSGTLSIVIPRLPLQYYSVNN